MDIKKLIEDLIDKRNEILDEDYESDVDSQTYEIKKLIFENSKELSFDFIIESLTHLGFAPNIIYDDNGNFQISDSSFHEIPLTEDGGVGKLGGQMLTIVEPEKWFPTMREALNDYISDLI